MNELYQILRDFENYIDKINQKASHAKNLAISLENAELSQTEIQQTITDILLDISYIIRETKH